MSSPEFVELISTGPEFVELPWAHSSHTERAARSVWVNPTHVAAVSPGRDHPDAQAFVNLAGGKGYLIDLAAAEVMERLGAAS